MGDGVNKEARAVGLSLEDEKFVFLMHFRECRCKVSKACELTEISVEAFHNWMRTDETFLDQVRAVQIEYNEQRVDLAEEMLEANVLQGKSADIKFTLEKLGEHRGYGKRLAKGGSGRGALGSGQSQKQLSWPEEPRSLEEWESTVVEAEIVKTEDKPKPKEE